MPMKKRLAHGALALLGALLLTSCQSQQAIIVQGPADLAVRAAPGAPGQSVVTAEAFLKQSPFPPAGRTLLHEGLCYSEPFYHDAALDPAGKDTDRINGVDRGVLFFVASHGTPEMWLAMPHGRDPVMCPQSAAENHAVFPRALRLGNGQSAGDGLRYFWQCASSVFAHGPRNCPSASPEHGCPEGFDGTQDTVLMRNAYERWGSLFAPGLRMACGFSTTAHCDPDDTRRAWELYDRGRNRYPVADTFIEGFRQGREGTLPLCIAMGGADAERTALFDEAFVAAPTAFGATHFHTQYPVAFRSTPPAEKPDGTASPRWAPIYGLKPMALPPTLTKLSFEKQGALLVSRDLEAATDFTVAVQPASGALYLTGKTKFDAGTAPLTEEQYLERASRFLKEMAMGEAGARPEGVRMMIESVPVVNKTYDVFRRQKSVVVHMRRQVDIDGKPHPVLGDGGLVRLHMNNDGSVARASKVWRESTGIRKFARVRPYETTYGEALTHLSNPAAYALESWQWGYKEFEADETQADLRIVHVFYFVPKPGSPELQAAPAKVEIAAQLDMTEATIDR